MSTIVWWSGRRSTAISVRGEGWPLLVSLYARALAADDDLFLATILHAAMALAFSPDKDRVRICGNCGWLFIDKTRNANKRWCTLTCSSRTKARRYYARRQSSRFRFER